MTSLKAFFSSPAAQLQYVAFCNTHRNILSAVACPIKYNRILPLAQVEFFWRGVDRSSNICYDAIIGITNVTIGSALEV